MICSISSKVRVNRAGFLLLFICGYSIIAITALRTYIHPFSINFLLGVIALISAFRLQDTIKHSLRFAVPGLMFALLYLFVPAKTVVFASIVLAVLFMVETFAGRINYLTTACLVLMSPIAEYTFNLFSFPIRLFLTSVSGKVLQVIYPETKVEGNMIIMGISEFSVDPACMGLHMLVASFMAGIILISLIQERAGKQMPVYCFIAGMLMIFLFNIISNLFRIICLVYFSIGPDLLMHDIIGMACFIVYVIVPSIYCIRYLTLRFGKINNRAILQYSARVPRMYVIQNLFLFILIIGVVLINEDKTVNDRISTVPVTLPGYATSQLPDRITKLHNQESLIYIKPIAGFYSSDHQPMICWGGSGYEFSKVQEKQIGSVKVYWAVLQKQNQILYTGWWYDNGISTTISQLEWRWNSFCSGRRYALVNVTAATPTALEKEINKLMVSNPVAGMLALAH